MKWLTYYKINRRWLVRMQVWGTFNGRRRPYSGFILATVTALEPKLHHILPFVLDLNNNPDDIIAALGLNFNPEEQLHLVKIDNISNTTAAKTVESQAIPQSSVAQSSVSKPSISQSSVSKPSVSQSSASKPSVSQQPLQKSKALPAVPVVVDSFKQQNNNQKEQAHSLAQPREQISQTKISQTKISQTKVSQTKRAEPTIDVTVTKPTDKFGKDASSIQDANRQSFPQKPLPHPQTKLQTNFQQNLPQNIPQNIKKLPTDKPQTISVASNSVTSEVEDNRREIPQQKIGLNQQLRTETKVSKTIRSQEELKNQENFQRDNNNESDEQPARVNRLAKWIDELCQGSGWDRDDMIFIRF
ncbi:hypothetical protein BC008_38855 [Mastigocoleus testarum BC008]|uniref:DUF5331 domain-containing protein n=2 Tax=Mastigocoleus TaxID=996924 RepID=A0A0V7ZFN3_9CYAN|nr:hypothetical protein BC008_38855 [Mastigocoleus testarum BC008]